MTVIIPETHKDLLDGPVTVTLVTVMPNGQPQATPVWCSRDTSHVLLNTARGRQKEINMAQRPKAAILAVDPQDPLRWIEIRGTVVEITEEGAVEHIDELARLYRGYPSFYGYAAPVERAKQDKRVICRLKPTRINVAG